MKKEEQKKKNFSLTKRHINLMDAISKIFSRRYKMGKPSASATLRKIIEQYATYFKDEPEIRRLTK